MGQSSKRIYSNQDISGIRLLLERISWEHESDKHGAHHLINKVQQINGNIVRLFTAFLIELT